jgi:putative transposase
MKGLERCFTMEALYDYLDISRQSHHKWLRRRALELEHEELVCNTCKQYRENHKRMSSRKIYSIVQDAMPFGRDKFERYAHRNGFAVRIKRAMRRTTIPLREGIVPNLIEGMVLNGPRQVFQSDIFYLKVEDKTMYGFVIIDVYTKELQVLHIADNMRAEELVKAVKKLARKIGIKNLMGAIFHSDRGSQFGDRNFIRLCNELGIRRSMGKRSQQNAYAERVQGTIQYEYLFEENITLTNLNRQMAKITRLYNLERPHYSLGGMTPDRFAQEMNKTNVKDRPETRIYQWVEPILPKEMLMNKKEKSSKKEKTLQHNY